MQTNNLVGGQWLGGTADTLDITDPATGATIAQVPNFGADVAATAITAAAKALPAWRSQTAQQRGGILRRLADLMLANRDRLAALMVREQGKPMAEARGEIDYAASFIDWAAEEGKRVNGEILPASHPGKRILVLRQGVGVCAAITPWNFPAAMITRKLGPALAAGCTMVIKPAEQTPLSALALAELCVEAGVPAGVVNVVTGDAVAIGEELLRNPIVRKLSFTGSTEVGRILMRNAAQNLTRLSLELGGHAPFLVFEDADLERAVEGLMVAKFRNAGQTCICANRVYVAESIREQFGRMLASAIESLQVGQGDQAGVHVGPLIDDAALAKVESHVQDAIAHGATVLTGGQRARLPGLADRFYQPTLLDNVSPKMRIYREETFGPVCPLIPFGSEEEAIAMANDSDFGLAAYFYTRDAGRLMRVAEALDYGIVGANDGAPSTVQAPFGGVKHSGFGREGGRYVMHEYLETKYVSWGL